MRFFGRLIAALFVVGIGLFCLLMLFGPRANLESFPHAPKEQGEIQEKLEPSLDGNH